MDQLLPNNARRISFKKNISKWLVVTSGIYLVFLPLGFPHLLFLVASGFLFMERSTSAIISKFTLALTFGVIVFAVIQLLVGAKVKNEINFLTSILAFVLTYELLKKYAMETIISISIKFIRFTTAMLFLEFIVRFVLATLFPTSADFYRYKFHSFMFQDTNFAGALILTVYFYAYFLQKRFGINLKFYSWVLFFLTFLSFSRAAMLALVLSHLLFYRVKANSISTQVLTRLLIVAGLLALAFPFILANAMEDPSFRSKLYILGLYESSAGFSTMHLLFGNGIGQSESVLEGLYAHNIILLYFLELGVIGCIAFITLITVIVKRSKGYALYVFIPFLITALSAVGHGLHYLYVVFALLCLIRYKEKELA